MGKVAAGIQTGAGAALREKASRSAARWRVMAADRKVSSSNGFAADMRPTIVCEAKEPVTLAQAALNRALAATHERAFRALGPPL